MNRKELIEAAKKRTLPRSGHLAECSECQDAVRLFRIFPVTDSIPLPDAPGAWVNRAIAIAEGSKILGKVRQIAAKLVFDSWAAPQPVGVRGSCSLDDRRLRFESAGILLDLRAERQKKGWFFMAQATGSDIDKSTSILNVDKKVLVADKNGFYEWSSNRPPKNLSLVSEKFSIQIPEIVWKKPRSK